MIRTLIVIPTYNEVGNLPGILHRVHNATGETDVLIVDDSSPDGTGALADQLASVDPRIHVLHRAQKDGLGGAYRAGFAWGLARDYDRLVEMDADGSHDPAHLPALLEALDDADVAVGSRWIDGGRAEGWPLHRRLLSRGGSAYARLMLGITQRDVTGGFRAYRADALREIDPTHLVSQGYSFQIEMLWRAANAGHRIIEVPITFVERLHGTSKMSSTIVTEALARVTRWGLARPLIRQILTFIGVGAIGLAVDVITFNLLRATILSPEAVPGGALAAKVISVTLAIVANWLGNRYWTFAEQRRSDVGREAVDFLLASALGGLASLVTLGVSHYALGLHTAIADNISANVIGLALGSAVRFITYREWVFAGSPPARRHLTTSSANSPNEHAGASQPPAIRG
ncbi:glycosyltransferase family 2 protein [Microbacterium pumilum]|uniref:Glycosyltransferase n=1 Tax=Microbacterium pumilum TaxID=344165 RepID=A0ABN2SP32_9MICO